MTKPKLLIVEDDEAIRLQLKYALREGFDLAFAEDGPGALKALAEHRPPVVTLDLGLPPSPDTAEEGLRTLEAILEAAPGTKVVVMTGNADRANALRAVSLGAFDYHLKPVELEAVKVVLQRAAHLHQLEREAEKATQAAESSLQFQDILGSTPRMKEIFNAVSRVARTDATVLVQGESGTGKELIARAIHARSGRRSHPFVPINCGAIPETLLESELFGHEKGAYTGAHVQRKGKIEVAEGGTLFLDEIAEMSLLLQVKLLRFLQEREIERVGGREPIKVDVRIIAATNKDLQAEIRAGRFREDLYYRLSVVTIKVPPLRERGEDIVLLANTFLRRSAQQHRRKVRFSAAALEAIARYPWPGNIRELENTVQRAVIMTPGRLIEPADLGIPFQDQTSVPSLREARSQREREILVEALIKTKGNISHAAANLGISRPTFHGLLDKHQINARDFKA
ncbi:MAG TPA: PEP-CTERM-box response regulator transcription factor [Candidatus Tectomicrobia bacterium]|nr:PEP-CTERM-box response regulator transcription factor [Candidatus Tectomicrobia bacterium]